MTDLRYSEGFGSRCRVDGALEDVLEVPVKGLNAWMYDVNQRLLA